MRDERPKKIGRPTHYREEMCDIVREIGREGGSVAEMAVACRIAISKLYEYSDRHDCFREAFRFARDSSLAWWYLQGRTNLNSKDFDTDQYKFMIKNKSGFGRDSGKRLSKLATCKTIKAEIEEIKRLIANNDLTDDEHSKLTRSYSNLYKVEEAAEIIPVLEKIKKHITTEMV